jgi:hypothetical protein
MKRTLLTILAVILTSLPAFSQTKVTGEKIVNSTVTTSTIDSTPIGSTTRSNVSATWMLFSAAPPNPIIGNSVELGWDATGLGEADFVDDYGTASGGFNWYAVGGSGSSHSWTPSSPLMHLDISGNLTAAKFIGSFSGNVTGNLNGNASTASALAADPANCATGQVATGINASGVATCVNGVQSGSGPGGTTGSATYSSTTSTVTFSPGYGDANYRAACTLIAPSDPRAVIVGVTSLGTSSLVVEVATMGSVSISYSGIDCLLQHP